MPDVGGWPGRARLIQAALQDHLPEAEGQLVTKWVLTAEVTNGSERYLAHRSYDLAADDGLKSWDALGMLRCTTLFVEAHTDATRKDSEYQDEDQDESDGSE